MNRTHKMGIVLSFLAVLCLCLSGCGSNKSSAAPVKGEALRAKSSPNPTPLAHSELDETEPDSDGSEVEDEGDKGEDEEDSDTEYFHGYRCTLDCSGHEAGYRWAEEHGIDDADDCGGNSHSFIEGCQAWAEENP